MILEDGTNRFPQKVSKELTTTRREIAQKKADLIYVVILTYFAKIIRD